LQGDGAKYAHEAGYDAYLTGAVFAYELFLLQVGAQTRTLRQPTRTNFWYQSYFWHQPAIS
jgi:hypothetical protein